MPELLVQINGETLPLRSCHWVLFDGDNCAMSSDYGDGATHPEAAHRNFTPRRRDRDRQTRLGYHVELLSKQQWDAKAAACFYGKCEHRKVAAS